MRNAYSWSGQKNFGDRLTAFLLTQLGVPYREVGADESDFVAVGSIIEHLPGGWAGTVAGAGLLRPGIRADLRAANVIALRGRLTRSAVDLKTGSRPVLGDPGLLVSQFVRQKPAKYDLGVIPHWSDTELAQRFPYGHVIDVRGRVWDVVSEIAQCKRIISSSLHGLIVADAYGIPRQAEIFAQAEREGGDFKFRDYQSIYGGPVRFGQMWSAPHGVVAKTQKDLRAALATELGHDTSEEVPRPKARSRHFIKWRRPQISLLVPFRDDREHRTRVWGWLRRYWESQLDSVEVIMGHDGGWPFSKAAAVNDAARRAHGKNFVILDADAYMDANVIQQCADRLDLARRHGFRTWMMPYNRLYRLSRENTLGLLYFDPREPYQLPSPPPAEWLESDRNTATYGHKFGAMAQVMPREAFFATGGMDPRFRGWGSEDASFLKALDTLWGLHEVTDNDLVHMWHSRPGKDVESRRWVGQTGSAGMANSRLAQRYGSANGEPHFMRGLADERESPRPGRRWLV